LRRASDASFALQCLRKCFLAGLKLWPVALGDLRPARVTPKESILHFSKTASVAHRLLRTHCGDCRHHKPVAFGRKRCGYCPACAAAPPMPDPLHRETSRCQPGIRRSIAR
jgi:hypothetical protein